MMSIISDAVTASASRGMSALLRNAQVQRFIKAPILDWVIPPALFILIVAAAGWIVFVPK